MRGTRAYAHPLGTFRNGRGLTQEELAVRAGIGRSRLSEIESGRVVPLEDEISRLEQALATTRRHLFDPAFLDAHERAADRTGTDD